MDYPHEPVLVERVLDYLISDPDGLYVDGTVGTGGHSEAVGRRLGEGGRLICLDRDPEAIALSKERLGGNVRVVRASYSDLDHVLEGLGVKDVDGVLLDLGMSSLQLDRSGRGFSFQRDEPLDMRMDPEEDVTASQLINTLPQEELERILKEYGEERKAKSIAKVIVREREKKGLHTSGELARLVASVLSSPRRLKGRHPATRTFQALRIAVNRELSNLELFLKKVPFLIKKGGRLVVISYHSLEDRRVKEAMKGWEASCVCPPDFPFCTCGKSSLFRRLTKRGVRASEKEIAANPRARSATLRAAERM